jgi:hypothetical protein
VKTGRVDDSALKLREYRLQDFSRLLEIDRACFLLLLHPERSEGSLPSAKKCHGERREEAPA